MWFIGSSQNINITAVLKKLESNPHGQIWEAQTSVEEVTADMVESTRELELEVEPEDVTELLKSHNKTNRWRVTSYGWTKEIVFWGGNYSWKKCYEDCCNDKKDLEYYINLADRARGGLEKIDSHSKSVLLWVKCYQTALPAT